MPRIELPSPTLHLQPRRGPAFLLAHEHSGRRGSWPAKLASSASSGTSAASSTTQSRCWGRNPELVLQARVASYRPALLAELLYFDRTLIDGWDKQAAIHLATDWPYFARHRAWARRDHSESRPTR